MKESENVHYLDEYPNLEKKVRLRRLAKEATGKVAVPQVIQFPRKKKST